MDNRNSAYKSLKILIIFVQFSPTDAYNMYLKLNTMQMLNMKMHQDILKKQHLLVYLINHYCIQ